MRATFGILGRTRVIEKGEQFFRAFWHDTDGIILPYVTVMLVVIIGVSVLALDGARYMYLQTQLQNGADALALTAAAELDRTPTAIARALNAIDKFGSGSDRNVKVADIKFLSSSAGARQRPNSANIILRAIRRGLRLSRSRSSLLRCKQFCRHQFSAAPMS